MFQKKIVSPLKFWRNIESGCGGTKSILSGLLVVALGSFEVKSAAASAVEDTKVKSDFVSFQVLF